jgi:hypothetical protein
MVHMKRGIALFCWLAALASGFPQAVEPGAAARPSGDWGGNLHGRPVIANTISIRVTAYNPPQSVDSCLEGFKAAIRYAKDAGIPSTYLLECTALREPRFVKIIKEELLTDPQCEIGPCFQVDKALIEAAGLKYTGPSDKLSGPENNHYWPVGFSAADREKLWDEFMRQWKELFGKYPRIAGGWAVDAYSLGYLHRKYGLVAAANCNDQWGTDTWTIWGAPQNHPYYPSRLNVNMPAQNRENELGIVMFRMCGLDPIYGPELTLHAPWGQFQKPGFFGAEMPYSRWFITNCTETPLSFAYIPGGQEAAWTGTGYRDQCEEIGKWVKSGRATAQTLEQTAAWFRSNYKVTPPSGYNFLSDWPDKSERCKPQGWIDSIAGFDWEKEHKSIHYSSRFYRINLFWEENDFRIRDIQLYDERCPESYYDTACPYGDVVYEALPVVNLLRWSTVKHLAGIRLVRIASGGARKPLAGGNPRLDTTDNTDLKIEWALVEGGKVHARCEEDKLSFSLSGQSQPGVWALELTWDELREPIEIQKVERDAIYCLYDGKKSNQPVGVLEDRIRSSYLGLTNKYHLDLSPWPYKVRATKGHFERWEKRAILIHPENDQIVLDLNTSKYPLAELNRKMQN